MLFFDHEVMTVTLPEHQGAFLNRLVASGRFATRDEALAEAVRRLETEEALGYLNPKPLTVREAEAVYAADPEWEVVERKLAGQAKPET
jgi:Arc/MetJ-type ribon-helix-helix transcriptional regulator